MNKENDEILYFSDIVVHSNPFELNIDFIRNECKFMDKEDIYKWILDDELKLKDLQHQLEKKDKVINKVSERLKLLGKYEGETCTRNFKMMSADFNQLIEWLERGKNGNG